MTKVINGWKLGICELYFHLAIILRTFQNYVIWNLIEYNYHMIANDIFGNKYNFRIYTVKMRKKSYIINGNKHSVWETRL